MLYLLQRLLEDAKNPPCDVDKEGNQVVSTPACENSAIAESLQVKESIKNRSSCFYQHLRVVFSLELMIISLTDFVFLAC